MLPFPPLFSFIFLNLIFLSTLPLIFSQQPYIGKGTTLCASTDNSSSAFGYSCNGINKTCQSYLTFRSIYPYNTVSSVSQLLNIDPSELSRLNNLTLNTTLNDNQLVLVPVTCSCSGQYYQKNTSYIISPSDTYLTIANNTFQGLSTCQAIQAQDTHVTKNIYPGTNITIPLRCACPTKEQISFGFKYLLSYLVAKGQYVYLISTTFGTDTGRTLQANGLTEQASTIFPFTTLLIPIKNPPYLTIAPPPPPNPPPPPPPPIGSVNSPEKNSKSNKWKYALGGAFGGGFLVFFISLTVFFLFFRKPKDKIDPVSVSKNFEAIEKQPKKEEEKNEIDTKEFLDSISTIAQLSLTVYKFDELISATNNFSPECWIKGSVYRGNFKGDYAAIKEVDGDVSNEIRLLNKISHSNLIRLSGVCFNEGHWYLIYEYASNGSLSDWVYNDNNKNNIDGKFLSWTQRMQIALDVAMGLNYIHNYTSPPYVHKDVTSNNVLLDSDLRAKVANFGLTRSAEKGESAFTRHIVGTQGYMAPEYLENGLISTKLDVYAFGVLMLELITGKEAVVLHKGNNNNTPLSDILNDLLDEKKGNENLSKYMDFSLEGNYPTEIAVFVARLIENCIKKDQLSRPGMDEIVQSLSKIVNSSFDWETNINNPVSQSFS